MGGDEKRASVSKDAADSKLDKIPAGEAPIQNTYTFWYIKRNTGNKAESYEKSIKEIGEFKTVQGFWRLYNHLMRPNDLPNTMDYHLFKAGIKPMWEDSANKRGGKWMVRLRKGIASRYWEDLVLAIIGERFDVGNEICGAVISVRYNEDIISLWNRNADNDAAVVAIRDTIVNVLNLPSFVSLEYKRHDTSLTDNSSFRNTTLWRSDSSSKNDGNSSSARDGQSNARSSSHRTSGGANQRDSHSTTSRGDRSDRSDRSERDSSSRFSRDKFDKTASGSSSGQTRTGWRDSSSSKQQQQQPRSGFFKTAGVGDDSSRERTASSDRANAWQQK